MNQFLASGSQSIGTSASVLLMNIQGWFRIFGFRIDWFDLAFQGSLKRLLQLTIILILVSLLILILLWNLTLYTVFKNLGNFSICPIKEKTAFSWCFFFFFFFCWISDSTFHLPVLTYHSLCTAFSLSKKKKEKKKISFFKVFSLCTVTSDSQLLSVPEAHQRDFLVVWSANFEITPTSRSTICYGVTQ